VYVSGDTVTDSGLQFECNEYEDVFQPTVPTQVFGMYCLVFRVGPFHLSSSLFIADIA
jgi:hypothetical protein